MAITPQDTPSSPEHFAQVATSQMDIQAPLSDGEIGAAFDQANADGGNGVLYPMSERIMQAKQLLQSPAGFGSAGFDVDAGASAGWPTDVEPTDDPNNGGYGGA
jgi:hypothetical protein